MFEEALDYAAAVRVCGEVVGLTAEGFDDETEVFEGYEFDDLLDDVVAVLVAYAFEDGAFEFADDVDLLVD